MSEPVARERPTVDLDDFERRLRQHDHNFEDPLAELARLVGEKHDPYGEVFAQEARAHQPAAYQPEAYQPAGHQPPTFDTQGGMSPRLSGDFAAIEAGLRGALAAHPEAYPHGDDAAAQHEFYAQQEQYAQHDQGAYLQDHEDQQWVDPSQQRAAPQVSRSRRPIYAMVATIAIGVIGVGVAFAYKGTSSSPSEIRTIAAASGPNKIHPPVDAANDQGGQDPAILGKTGAQAPTRLVSGEEQPVDISQAVQENTSRNADAGSGQGDAASVPLPPSPSQAGNGSQDPTNTAPDAVLRADQIPGFGMSDMPPPKKVKVISVRPDGTILSNNTAPNAITPTADVPVASDSMPAMDSMPAPVAKASTPKASGSKLAGAKTNGAKTTSRVTTKPTPVAQADDGSDVPVAKPLHKAKPKVKPKTVDVASLEPSADNSQPSSDAAAKPSGGGFAVQLAAPGSEAEARSASSRLAKKFADALDGRRLGFHKAQSNGKSVFRVRVGSLTREDATSLCEKLKAAGGSCFIAKNN